MKQYLETVLAIMDLELGPRKNRLDARDKDSPHDEMQNMKN